MMKQFLSNEISVLIFKKSHTHTHTHTQSLSLSLIHSIFLSSLSLSLYIYIYIYRERERDNVRIYIKKLYNARLRALYPFCNERICKNCTVLFTSTNMYYTSTYRIVCIMSPIYHLNRTLLLFKYVLYLPNISSFIKSSFIDYPYRMSFEFENLLNKVLDKSWIILKKSTIIIKSWIIIKSAGDRSVVAI